MSAKSKSEECYRIISENRRARFDYHVEETVEAGLCLLGDEVKSLRASRVSIQESYATFEGGEIFLINSNVPYYEHSFLKMGDYNPKRRRKLLLQRKQIRKFLGLIERKGYTLIPLRLYFNHKGLAKLTLGIAIGKNKADKRQTIKEREWNRDKARTFREYNKA